MRRKIVVSGVAMVAMTTAGMLTALAPPVAAASGGTIKVAYENYGTNLTLNTLMQKVGVEFQKMYPGWTVDLEPIAAPENPYYTKLDLMSQSASTAPDNTGQEAVIALIGANSRPSSAKARKKRSPRQHCASAARSFAASSR